MRIPSVTRRSELRTAVAALAIGACAATPNRLSRVAKTAASPPGPAAPVAAEQPVIDDYFGEKLTDPYRWMENVSSPDFRTYLGAQNAFAARTLDQIPNRGRLRQQVLEATRSTESVRDVMLVGSDYVYAERSADREKFRLQRRKISEPSVGAESIVDIENLNVANIDYFTPSPDWKYLAYGASANGSEDSDLHVLDLNTNLPVSAPTKHCRNAEVRWLPHEAAFLYARAPEPTPDSPISDVFMKQHVFLRRLRTTKPDQPVFGYGMDGSPFVEKTETIRVIVNETSPFALGVADFGVSDAPLISVKRLADLSDVSHPWTVIVPKSRAVREFFALHGNDIFTIESGDAPKHKMVRYQLHDDGKGAQSSVFLPEGTGTLREVQAASDALYVTTLEGGFSHLLAVPYAGGAPREVLLPPQSAIRSYTLSANATEPGCVLQSETWTTSARWLACNASDGCRDTGLLPPANINFSDVVVERTEATSADGTRIPLTVLSPRTAKRDGSSPTILDGYGAYGVPRVPSFQSVRRAWFDAGGVIAFAHVRGGGEFGEGWHLAGSRGSKARAIEDFVACAEKLIAMGITSKAKLAASGGSAGGILVSGVVLKRPDLFRAAVVNVGFANMVRLEQGGSGAYNAAEFGSISSREGFESLLAMDAYHHVKPGTPYPAMLYTAGFNDARVPPWHPAKMVASLQRATTSGRPVLLRVNFGGGHGDMTRDELVTERTDAYSFLLWQLGQPGYAPGGR